MVLEIANGRKALVTGGASGLGLGVASRLVKAGASVAIADVDRDGCRASAIDLGAVDIEMDVSSSASVRSGVLKAAAALRGLDTLVNCAGVFAMRPFDEVAEEEWDRVLDVNLKGTFLCCQAALPYLRESGRGRIVNVSSNAGRRGYPLMSSYVASKFGVVGLTESLAAELGPDGITVNVVCPSTVGETGIGRAVIARKVELFGKSTEQLIAERAASFPLGRSGTVADVAETIMFLISEGASWISGSSINIDGGALSG